MYLPETNADVSSVPFRKLTVPEWITLLGAESCPGSVDPLLADSSDMGFRFLTQDEKETVFLRMIRLLDSPLEVAGSHRKERWVKGWAETRDAFIKSEYDVKALRPQFVRQREIMRLGYNYVAPATDSLESAWVELLRRHLFRRFFSTVTAVYEFGAGTGHNMVSFSGLFPDKPIHALDWVQPAVDIYDLLRTKLGLNIKGHLFDLSSPRTDLHLERGAGVLTIGALEQMGNRWGPFLDFLIAERPEMVVHVETTYELYEQTKLIDYLGARYLEKRGYLSGYLTELRRREAAGEIEILTVRRTFGGLCHDGYSFIAWRVRG